MEKLNRNLKETLHNSIRRPVTDADQQVLNLTNLQDKQITILTASNSCPNVHLTNIFIFGRKK